MNEKSIISPNSEIKKRRLENEKDHHVTMEQQWEADVRPIADVEMTTVGVFKYKLVNELSFPLQPFRTATANRQWYRIKNELEIKFHLSKAKQEKKSLVHSAFLAFHLSDWEKMEQRSDMYNVTKTSALEAHYEVKPDDVLVIARLPAKVVKRVYTDVEILKFTEGQTEEEKLARLLNYNSVVRPPPNEVEYDRFGGLPPPGYKCHNCGSNQHFRQQCLGKKRVNMRASGIPKLFLEQSEASDVLAPGESIYTLDDGTTVKAKIVGADVLEKLKNCY